MVSVVAPRVISCTGLESGKGDTCSEGVTGFKLGLISVPCRFFAQFWPALGILNAISVLLAGFVTSYVASL